LTAKGKRKKMVEADFKTAGATTMGMMTLGITTLCIKLYQL
jgi:hypothetical protein